MAHLCVSDKSCPQLVLCLYSSCRGSKVFSESSYMDSVVTTATALCNCLRIWLGTGDIRTASALGRAKSSTS